MFYFNHKFRRIYSTQAPNPERRSRKRKRGGQPGNQNGRKHGLYSLAATTAQRKAISKAAKVNTPDQEIALLRVKIKSAIKNNPENIGAVSSASQNNPCTNEPV